MTTTRLVAVSLAMVVTACMPAAPSAGPTVVPTVRATPTPVPAPPTEAAVAPENACSPDQIEVVKVEMGDPGWVGVRIRPVGADSCAIRLYPDTAIQDSGGITLVESRQMPGGPEFYPLEDELFFDLAWSVECPRPTLMHPLTAWIGFAPLGSRTAAMLPDKFVPACVLFSAGMGVGPGFSLNGEGGEGGIGG